MFRCWPGRCPQLAERGRRARATATLLGAVVSAVAMALEYAPGNPSLVYYGTDTHAFALLIGAALALAPETGLGRRGTSHPARLGQRPRHHDGLPAQADNRPRSRALRSEASPRSRLAGSRPASAVSTGLIGVMAAPSDQEANIATIVSARLGQHALPARLVQAGQMPVRMCRLTSRACSSSSRSTRSPSSSTCPGRTVRCPRR